MEMEFGDIERGTISITRVTLSDDDAPIEEAFLIEVENISDPELIGASLSRAEVERLIEQLQEILK